MPTKCSAYNCNVGYKTCNIKVPVYKFPKDPETRRSWVRAMPNALKEVTNYMGLCARHFPDCKVYRRYGHALVPQEPPTYFPDVPPSTVGTPQPAKRTTAKTTAASRRPHPDHELHTFREVDCLKLDTFAQKIKEHFAQLPGQVLWKNANHFNYISDDREGPLFKVSIFFWTSATDLVKYNRISYEAFVGLRQVKHPANSLSVNCWSGFYELVRYVLSEAKDESDHPKTDFLQRQVELVNKPKNCRLYSLADMNQAFELYAQSRRVYKKLTEILQLPSGMNIYFYFIILNF